jgi:hypothetical protein
MKRANTIRLISNLCFSFAGASSGQATLESHEQFVCTSGPARKIVSIYNQAAQNGAHGKGVCRVDYTKDGKTKTLWSSNSDHAYCTTKALSLVTRLIQGNYSCKPESVSPPNETDPAKQAPPPQADDQTGDGGSV